MTATTALIVFVIAIVLAVFLGQKKPPAACGLIRHFPCQHPVLAAAFHHAGHISFD